MPKTVYGLDAVDGADGTRYLKLHHYADPEKDSEWIEKIRLSMLSTPGDFRREYLMDETVQYGEPVFADYRDELHCPRLFMPGGIPIVKGSSYIGGWDAGGTLNPAFVLLQITPPPHQVHCIMEVIPSRPESMETFAPMVSQALMRRFPTFHLDIEHWGDETITQRGGQTGHTAQQVAARHGIIINRGKNALQGRLGAVTWLLADMIDDRTPRFFVCPVHAPTIRKGFQGGYRYEEAKNTPQSGPERRLLMPLKNKYSHSADALQMAAMEAVKRIRDAKQMEKMKWIT